MQTRGLWMQSRFQASPEFKGIKNQQVPRCTGQPGRAGAFAEKLVAKSLLALVWKVRVAIIFDGIATCCGGTSRPRQACQLPRARGCVEQSTSLLRRWIVLPPAAWHCVFFTSCITWPTTRTWAPLRSAAFSAIRS